MRRHKGQGDPAKRALDSAAQLAIDATMSAAIKHAKQNHSAGAHGQQRFVTGGHIRRKGQQAGDLERSIRIQKHARQKGRSIVGTWGSIGIVYARRTELGVQGKDSKGRVFNQPSFPFLRPAADAEYPKLFGRIRRAASVA